jgi:hypothetical protein
MLLTFLPRPGCYMCHLRLRNCNTPTKGDQASAAVPKNGPSLEELKEYPSDEDEILSTWSTRARLWEDLYASGGGRRIMCDDHRQCLPRAIDTESHEVCIHMFHFPRAHPGQKEFLDEGANGEG